MENRLYSRPGSPNVIVIDKIKCYAVTKGKKKRCHSFAPLSRPLRYQYRTRGTLHGSKRTKVYDQVTNQGTFLFCDPTRESDFVIGQLISSTAESWLQAHGSTGYQSHIVLYSYSSTSNLSYIKVKRCTTDTVTLSDPRWPRLGLRPPRDFTSHQIFRQDQTLSCRLHDVFRHSITRIHPPSSQIRSAAYHFRGLNIE